MARLGVNLDHIATLREARKTYEPDPLEAVFIAKNAGAHQITLHLREDRRHINDQDLERILQSSPLPVNIESSCDEKNLAQILKNQPQKITLVPENRAEITTEGGLKISQRVSDAIQKIRENAVVCAVFIEPDLHEIERAKILGADEIELHTGRFANLFIASFKDLASQKMLKNELKNLKIAANFAHKIGLKVCAGHGLTAQNISLLAQTPEIYEFNIGHSIISRAIFVGLHAAITEILRQI